MKKASPIVIERVSNDNATVSFKYDPVAISALKSIPQADYSFEHRAWVLPVSELPILLKSIDGTNVQFGDESLRAVPRIEASFLTQPTRVNPDFRPLFPTFSGTMDAEDHQATGSTWLIENTCGIQADDMGLGKTKQFIDAVQHVSKTEGVKRVLVVCKATNVDTWLDEIKKFAPQSFAWAHRGAKRERIFASYFSHVYDCDVVYVIVSYETFRADVEMLAQVSWDWAALDEAHKAKSNPLNDKQSKIGQAIHKVRPRRRTVITGTPLVNAPEDAWNLLRWLGIDNRSWKRFEEDTLVTVKVQRSAWTTEKRVVDHRPLGIHKLKSILANHMIRRLKDDVTNIPPKIYQTINVPLNAEENKRYQAALKEYALWLEDDRNKDDIANEDVQILRLKQIVSNIEPFLNHPYRSSKIVTAGSICEDAVGSGQKVLIFTQFVSTALALARELRSYNPALIHGGISTNAKGNDRSPRQQQVDRFQNDPNCKVFIGTTGVCREGLTLTAASVIIHVDKEWTPAYVSQLEDRARRIGQTRNVTVYSLMATTTPDDDGNTDTVDFWAAEKREKRRATIASVMGV